MRLIHVQNRQTKILPFNDAAHGQDGFLSFSSIALEFSLFSSSTFLQLLKIIFQI